jgi:biotin carboxyl carrier protein
VKREAVVGERVLGVEVAGSGPRYTVTLEGRAFEVDWSDGGSGLATLVIEGESVEAGALARDGGYSVLVKGHMVDVTLRDAAAPGTPAARAGAGGPTRITAPMPGRLVKVLVQEGDSVGEGQGLVVMEAMKMENELRAPRAGRVKELPARERQAVETGALLVVLE